MGLSVTTAAPHDAPAPSMCECCPGPENGAVPALGSPAGHGVLVSLPWPGACALPGRRHPPAASAVTRPMSLSEACCLSPAGVLRGRCQEVSGLREDHQLPALSEGDGPAGGPEGCLWRHWGRSHPVHRCVPCKHCPLAQAARALAASGHRYLESRQLCAGRRGGAGLGWTGDSLAQPRSP